jgi:hypothetical protein
MMRIYRTCGGVLDPACPVCGAFVSRGHQSRGKVLADFPPWSVSQGGKRRKRKDFNLGVRTPSLLCLSRRLTPFAIVADLKSAARKFGVHDAGTRKIAGYQTGVYGGILSF